VRPLLPCATVHLVRDPRDVFLSAVAFLRDKGFARGFGRDATTSDLDHARNLAHALLLYHENERADRGRDDATLVRYEDFVADRTAVAARLSRLTGLEFPADGGDEYLGRHPPVPTRSRRSALAARGPAARRCARCSKRISASC